MAVRHLSQINLIAMVLLSPTAAGWNTAAVNLLLLIIRAGLLPLVGDELALHMNHGKRSKGALMSMIPSRHGMAWHGVDADVRMPSCQSAAFMTVSVVSLTMRHMWPILLALHLGVITT
jgi:hypothetical protein